MASDAISGEERFPDYLRIGSGLGPGSERAELRHIVKDIGAETSAIREKISARPEQANKDQRNQPPRNRPVSHSGNGGGNERGLALAPPTPLAAFGPLCMCSVRHHSCCSAQCGQGV